MVDRLKQPVRAHEHELAPRKSLAYAVGSNEAEVTLNRYVPPSTRAAMAALGISYQSKRYGSVPPHELPGEQRWRTDFLRWHAFRVVGRASLLPGHMRDGYLARAEEALLAEGQLTEVEVDGVFECARRAFQNASQDTISREEWDEFFQRQKVEGEELRARCVAIFGAEIG